MTLLSQAPVEVLEHEAGTGRPLTIRAQSGVIAHFQRREDDCHAAAVATLLQLPYSEVPDARIDERLAGGEHPDVVNDAARSAFVAWLRARGLREVVSWPPPDHGAWLGVIPGEARFSGHVVVCCSSARGRWHVVHDPAGNWPAPPGHRVATAAPGSIVASVTLLGLENE